MNKICVSAWSPTSRENALKWYYDPEQKKQAREKYIDLLVAMPTWMEIKIEEVAV